MVASLHFPEYQEIDGFTIDDLEAMASSADDFEDEVAETMSEEEAAAFMAEFGLNPDGTRLCCRDHWRTSGVVDSNDPEFRDVMLRTVHALAYARRDLMGSALASLMAAAALAVASRTSRESCRAAQVAADAGDKRHLPSPPDLPAADPGINITPRVFPSPRT